LGPSDPPGDRQGIHSFTGDFYHGCQEKGQEKGWKEEGREEEVGFLQKKGGSAKAGSPFCC
jgi:hypothetical protein